MIVRCRVVGCVLHAVGRELCVKARGTVSHFAQGFARLVVAHREGLRHAWNFK